VKTYRIPFSRIRTAWVRRLLMVCAYLPMLAGNWLLILWAAAKLLPILPLSVLLKMLAAPFQLFNEGFTEAWHGLGPGSKKEQPHG
jgi:hypothetical protein